VCAFEPGAASRVGGHIYNDGKAGTVRANAGDNQQAVAYGISSYESNAMKSHNPHSGCYVAETARTFDNNGGNPACNQGGMMVVEAAGVDAFNQECTEECASTIRTGSGGDSKPMVCAFVQNQREEVRNLGEVIVCSSIVRRLTPLECERLQGFPDGWTDIGEWTDSKGKLHKEADSPRYKALGNSIALPFWQYLTRRICAQYERDITMGSLFDGIGGFPLVFEHCGAKAVWASEIDEFCMAVTKKHFKEEG
jgi:site-specific DNA-cytosine methylase